MWLVQACRGCLTTEGKLERVNDIAWRMFEVITGFEYKPSDGYPTMLCIECRWTVKKAIAYRRKCRRAFLVLKQIMMAKDVVLVEDIKKVDRKKNNLESSLGLWQTSNTACYNVLEIDIKKHEDLENKDIHMVDAFTETEKHEDFENKDLHNKVLDVFTVMNTVKPEAEQSILHIVNIPPYSEENISKQEESEVAIDENVDISPEDGKSFDFEDVFADLEVTSTDGHFSEEDQEHGFEEFNEIGDTQDVTEQEQDSSGEETEEEKATEKKEPSRKRNKTDFFKITHSEMTMLAKALENSTIRALSVDEQRAASTRRLTKRKFVEAMFRCVLCVRTYKSIEDLNAHARYHWHHRGDLKCDICSFSCKNGTDLLYHRASGHLYEYTCVHCSTVLHSSNDLSLHMQKKHGQLKSQLLTFDEITKKIPMTPEEMYRAEPKVKGKYTTKLKRDKYKCDICQTWIRTKRALKYHMQHHNYKYQCQMCQVTSMTRFKAKQHFEKHRPDTSECDICNRSFSNEQSVLVHKRVVHKVLGNLHCAECAYTCDGAFTYYKHQMFWHGYFIPLSVSPVDATFQCSQCDARFRNETALMTHARLHSGTVDNVTTVCPKCQKVCDDPEKMAKHVKGCRGLQKCPYCPTEMNFGLYLHVTNSHPGLPFVYKSETTLCETCGATVPVSRIQKHMLTHGPTFEDNKHKCPYCDFCNKQPVGVLTHVLRSHTQKPWQCKVCLSRFESRHKCKTHIIKAHDGVRRQKVRCEICEKELSALCKLKIHYRLMHGIEYKGSKQSVWRPTHKGRVSESVSCRAKLMKQVATKLILFPHMQLNLSDHADVLTDLVLNVEVQIYDYFWNFIRDVTDKHEYIKLSNPEAMINDCNADISDNLDEEEAKRRQKLKIDLHGTMEINHLPKDDFYYENSELLNEAEKPKKRPAQQTKRTVKSKVIKRDEDLQSESRIADTKVDFSTNIVVKKRKAKIPVAAEMVIEENEPCEPMVLDESSVFVGDDGCQYAMINGVLYKLEDSHQEI